MYEQKETTTGYIYYVNKQTGEPQNDNPKLLEIIKVIREHHKSIKFLAYRVATKIWFLKQSFYTVNIPYTFVSSVLSHYGFTQCDNIPILKPANLISLIHDIYFAAEKCDLFSQSAGFNLDRCTAVLVNFFWNIHDPKRSAPLSLLEFKQTMLILCDTQNYDQLVVDEFEIAADHNRCVNRYRFESIMGVLSKLFSFLEDNSMYSAQAAEGIVQECFKQCPGLFGLNEVQYKCYWRGNDTQFANYTNILLLIYRVKSSQNIVHDAQCISCKQSPIVGIRFKCQECRKLSLCFECFCTGYKNGKHEISHRMYEISTNNFGQKLVSSGLVNFIRNCCVRKRSTQQKAQEVLTLETKVIDERGAVGTTIIECINDTRLSSIRNSKQLKDQTAFSVIAPPSQQDGNQDKVNVIIDSLIHQSEQLQNYMVLSKKQRKKEQPQFLSEHQIFLTEVIDKLKNLKETQSNIKTIPHSSTPYRNNNNENKVKPRPLSIGSPLSKSIHGNELNRTYLENNRSDWSVADVSTWLHLKSQNTTEILSELQARAVNKPANPIDDPFETEMQNFRQLLNKIREILDDSSSDNKELSRAATKLEAELDNIIYAEERRRTYV